MEESTCCKLMFAIALTLALINCVELVFFNYSLSLRDRQLQLEVNNVNDRRTIYQLEENFTKEIKKLRTEMEKISLITGTLFQLYSNPNLRLQIFSPPFVNQPYVNQPQVHINPDASPKESQPRVKENI